MFRKLFSVVGLVLVSIVIQGQSIGKFEKKIKEDYDFFVQIMESNPQLDVRKKVQGLHLLDTLEHYRSEVLKSRNYKEFAIKLNHIANLFVDGHLYVAAYSDDFDDKLNKLNTKYNQYIQKPMRRKIVLPYGEFIDGRFYFVQTLAIKNKHGFDTIICSGMELVSIYGLNPYKYMNRTLSQRTSKNWDYNANEFYSNVFVSDGNRDELRIIVKHNNISKRIDIKKKGLLGFKTEFRITTEKESLVRKAGIINSLTFFGEWPCNYFENVLYLEKEKILYVRIPEMYDPENYFVQEIAKYRKGYEIEKVVIDIRNNPGGDDDVWMNVLQHIVKEPIVTKLKNGFRNTPLIKEKLKNDFDFSTMAVVDHLDFLPADAYLFEDEIEIIKPADSSVFFTGNIYVLQDNQSYSSSGALIAMALYHENIINIGQRTGFLLGRGMTPVTFVLPNSKLSLNFDPMIDLTNVERSVDVFHDDVEILVQPSIDEYLQYYAVPKFSKEFLLESDPWFRKVLNHQ